MSFRKRYENYENFEFSLILLLSLPPSSKIDDVTTPVFPNHDILIFNLYDVASTHLSGIYLRIAWNTTSPILNPIDNEC